MVINHLDKLFVTSDAATIIRELEVVHPAGKVLVMASQQQEHEVRKRLPFASPAHRVLDGRQDQPCHDSCRRAAQEGRVPPHDGITSFRGRARLRACTRQGPRGARESVSLPVPLLGSRVFPELTIKTLETPLTLDSLVLALRPTLASKQYGSEDLLAKLVAEAVLAVMPRDPKLVSRSPTSLEGC